MRIFPQRLHSSQNLLPLLPGEDSCQTDTCDIDFVGPVFPGSCNADYVALGDSYSSGEGLGDEDRPYYEGSTPVSARCHRHEEAYGPTYGREEFVPPAFYACSGALMSDITTSSRYSEPPQLHHANINANTELVTLTIGGNDTGWTDVLAACGLGDCEASKGMARFVIASQRYADDMRNTFEAIKDKVGPNTEVVVLGYPQLFPADPDDQDCLKLTPFTEEDQNDFREMTEDVRSVMNTAASLAGVDYVDVIGDFSTHEICGRSGTEWINGYVAPTFENLRHKQFYGDPSFHPNPDGHYAYRVSLETHLT